MPNTLSKEERRKVVFIDDEPAFLDMYRTKFESAGFAVETLTDDGTKDIVSTISAFKPDIIFLDLVMKKSDGIKILKSLKEDITTKWVPVVMLSNIDNLVDKEHCEREGASQFLVKSNFTPGDLLDYACDLLKMV